MKLSFAVVATKGFKILWLKEKSFVTLAHGQPDKFTSVMVSQCVVVIILRYFTEFRILFKMQIMITPHLCFHTHCSTYFWTVFEPLICSFLPGKNHCDQVSDLFFHSLLEMTILLHKQYWLTFCQTVDTLNFFLFVFYCIFDMTLRVYVLHDWWKEILFVVSISCIFWLFEWLLIKKSFMAAAFLLVQSK